MNELPLYIVDAFTATPFRGNPASVCLLEREIPETTMQAIAAEMNHSETAFALPLDGPPTLATRFSLRWFTPEVEVPLCGHATLATSAVIFREFANPVHEMHFETQSGRLSAWRDGARIALDFPAEDFRPTAVAPEVCAALGAREVKAACYARKDRNLLLHLGREAEVRDLAPDFTRLRAARPSHSPPRGLPGAQTWWGRRSPPCGLRWIPARTRSTALGPICRVVRAVNGP